jgi:DNA-binding IclR family transcriptional regulator
MLNAIDATGPESESGSALAPRSASARYVVPGLARGIEILRLFHAGRRTIAAPDMARELGIPRSTVFRLAQTLELLGLLERTDGGRAYALGVGVLSLGFEYVASLDVVQLAVPELEALRDTTGLSAHMVIRDGRDVVVVHRCPGRATFASALAMGKRLPAHATVLGRAALVDLDIKALAQLYGDLDRLPRFTAQTPVTLPTLAEQIGRDRIAGYALSQSFFEAGIASVAVPVRERSGATVAAINVTVPDSGGQKIDDELIAAVMSCAQRISTALGYRDERNG